MASDFKRLAGLTNPYVAWKVDRPGTFLESSDAFEQSEDIQEDLLALKAKVERFTFVESLDMAGMTAPRSDTPRWDLVLEFIEFAMQNESYGRTAAHSADAMDRSRRLYQGNHTDKEKLGKEHMSLSQVHSDLASRLKATHPDLARNHASIANKHREKGANMLDKGVAHTDSKHSPKTEKPSSEPDTVKTATKIPSVPGNKGAKLSPPTQKLRKHFAAKSDVDTEAPTQRVHTQKMTAKSDDEAPSTKRSAELSAPKKDGAVTKIAKAVGKFVKFGKRKNRAA